MIIACFFAHRKTSITRSAKDQSTSCQTLFPNKNTNATLISFLFIFSWFSPLDYFNRDT